MAFNKTDKADGAKVRRGGMRRRKKVCVFCGDKNVKFFREELPVTVLSTREL